MPKISILTPIYNTKKEALQQAIESILNQTFSDFEFIILNDSPDNTELDEIINSYSDERIKYFKNEFNIGISKSRNKLLSMARGEYIAIFDHDDISLPERLEKQAAYLDANKEIGVVSSNVARFPEKIVSNHPVSNLDIKKTLTHSNVVAHTAMMIRKSILDSSGVCYEEKYSPAEDYMLCIRLMEHTMFHNLPEALVKWRFTPDNTTNKNWSKMLNADALCRCVAMKNYPYLYQSATGPVKYNKHWLYLFGIIPFLKIKSKQSKKIYLLFGFLPLFVLKGKK